ncbi:MAG TPA: UvrD-helicase domain-containing protein [Bacteroidales bacterium]|nr:UvrD-helicase domain-containing protein [Bacteroidales bacterium]
MVDFLKELNEVQSEAVVNYQGPSLVIAGAGSGKTRVLTFRIAYLLSQGVSARNVLSLTFTNKAAKEMKERIGSLVGESNARALWMGTFHSIFAKILRFEAPSLGYPSSFTIYDTQDSRNLIKTIIKDLKLDDSVYKPADIHSKISSAKNELITPHAYYNDPIIAERNRNSRVPMVGEIYKTYAVRCYKAGAMDFDDLLLNTNILFRDFPDILAKYQHMFNYILVDEYQDTNYAQYLIIKKLAMHHHNVCVVGDDAQSIYSFRGAKIENILNFRNDYPNYKLFKLEQNYRSTQTIVNAANSIIARNQKQIQKQVWSSNSMGDKIQVFRSATDVEEGFAIANSIYDTKYAERLKNSEFAILYRTNAQSRIFEEALRKRNIPYRVYGGLSFYQRKEIKDLLAYLRLIVNHKDDEAFKRIVNYPARGIGDTTVAKIEAFANANGKPIFEVACNASQLGLDINKGTSSKLMQFASLILSFSSKIENTDAYEMAYQVSTSSGILKDLQSDKTPENVSRYENVEELLNGIKDFTSNNSTGNGPVNLVQYLENVSLLTDADNEKDGDDDKVTIMTIHSSKGLEFGVVYIVGLEEGLFPSTMSMSDQREIEEERRLFYVALTRAKIRAFLSFAHSRYKWGVPSNCSPSRFIQEIDSQYVDFPTEPRGFESGQQNNDVPKRKFNDQSLFDKVPIKTIVPKKSFYTGSPNGVENGSQAFVADDPSKIQVGMQVLHERFGTGKVIQLEGSLSDLKAVVFFKDAGQKSLLLKFARLKILSSS